MILVVATLIAAAPSIVGEWALMGMTFARFNNNGTCVIEGEACTWKTQGNNLVIAVEGEVEVVPFTVTADALTIVTDGVPVLMNRVGIAPASPPPAATPPSTPFAPAPPAAGNAPKLDVKDPLAQLLLSSAWCTFSYNKNTGASSKSRSQFFPDGTWGSDAQSETYNSGQYGTVSGQQDTSSRGRWSVAKGQFWFAMPPQPGFPPNPLVPVALRVTRNSNGYPILTSPDGTEYMQCQ